MSPWDTREQEAQAPAPERPVMVPRAEAVGLIQAMARNSGYTKCNVRYNGTDVTPVSLPDMVDMSLVRISAVLNNA